MPTTPKFHRPPHFCFKKKASRSKKIRGTARWHKVRLLVLRKNPLCISCGEIANECDHIIPMDRDGSPYNISNLNSLCKPCHILKTYYDATWEFNYERDGHNFKIPIDRNVTNDIIEYAKKKKGLT